VRLGDPDKFTFRDTPKLLKILNEAGYDAALADVEWAWLQYSGSMCAQWLTVDIFEAPEIVSALLQYLISLP
jgi:hypothetical protein